MRIAYLTPIGRIGGAEASLLDLLTVLRSKQPRWEMSLIAGSEGPLLARAKDLGISTRLIPFPNSLENLGDAGAGRTVGPGVSSAAFLTNLIHAGAETPAYLKRLRQALRDFGPDLVHSNGVKMHLLSAFSGMSKVPVIWHIHDYVRSRPVTAHLLRWCAGRCSTAVANSASVAEDLRSLCRSTLQVEAVHNGIDTETFSPHGPCLDLDAAAGLEPPRQTVVRIGMVGTFARWKGHETFLRALTGIRSDIPFRGYFIGGPIYHTKGSQYTLDELKGLTQSSGFADKVGFTGFVDDPAAAMRSLDIVVHASTEPEPFGLVVVQAMACGKAVIVSGSGGVSEIVSNRINAMTHKPGDASELGARIQELMASPQLRMRLGEAARRTAQECFGRSRFANEFMRIYQGLLNTRN